MMRKKTAVLFLLMALMLTAAACSRAACRWWRRSKGGNHADCTGRNGAAAGATGAADRSDRAAGGVGGSGRQLRGYAGNPSDFPAAYNYGSGIQSEWEYNELYRKLPEPEDNQTVFNTAPDPSKIQVLYLWEEGMSRHRPNLPKT